MIILAHQIEWSGALVLVALLQVGVVIRTAPLYGLLPLDIKQGGYMWVGSRNDITVNYPISFSKVLGIAGLAVVNNQNSSGRGFEHIKTFSGSSFIYYSGFDIPNKWLTWLVVGI